jgi:hypothetical protein
LDQQVLLVFKAFKAQLDQQAQLALAQQELLGLLAQLESLELLEQ